MSNQIAGYKLGRSSGHRKALYRNLVRALLLHERIQTTLVKAKAVKGLTEKIISMGKKGDLKNRRDALALITDEKVVRKVFDDIADLVAGHGDGLALAEARIGFDCLLVITLQPGHLEPHLSGPIDE